MLKKLATILCAAAFGLAIYAPSTASACPGSDMETHKVSKKDKKDKDKKVAKKKAKAKDKAKAKTKDAKAKDKAKDKNKKVSRR